MYRTMNIKYKTGLLLVFLICISAGLFAQNLPQLDMKMLKNDTLEFFLKSYLTPSDNLYGPNHGVIDQLVSVGSEGNLKIWSVKYVPDPDFVGKDTVIIEYRGNPGNSIMTWHIKKVTLFIEVSNSIIEAKNDFEFSEINSAGDTIDILANDFTTGDSLFLDQIFNLKNCEAYITDDNKLFVAPFDGYVGNAFLNYTIHDEFGSSATGHLLMIVNDLNEFPDTLEYFVTNTNSLSFALYQGGYFVEGSDPGLGELDFSNDPEIVYTPFVDALGTDTFKLANATDTFLVIVNVIESDINSNLVIDDKVFTPVETQVSFNVSANDFKKNSFITSYTQAEHGTVVNNGQGNFIYTPEAEFLGFDKFTYTRQLSFSQYQTATVEIVVNDFLPYNERNYYINIPKNKQFVLSYDIPISDYSFDLNTPLSNGSVEFYQGINTIEVNCQEIVGKNLIVYTPDPDFIGISLVELRYCAPNNNCNVVKINFNILDTASDTACYCTAYTCIWEGDADNNGIVNVKDLIPLGKFAGTSGYSRSDFSDEWLGLNGTDWNGNSGLNKCDLKHADSNGDGFISELDSLSIVSNYNNIHNLYFDGETEKTKFPVYITTDQTEANSGDVLTIFINAGDEEYVAKDISAISYILQIEPEFIDSASLHHKFYLDSWLAGTTSSFQMSNHVFAGQVEAAFTKVGSPGVSGIGKISKCDFIIEDDFIGIKRDNIKNNRIPVKIRLTNVSALTSNNSIIGCDDAETTVYLRLKDKQGDKITPVLNVFPNPSANEVQLYIDGEELISNYRIFNVHGMLLDNSSVENQQQTNINTSRLKNGIYFIEVQTDKNNRIIRKIEVFK